MRGIMEYHKSEAIHGAPFYSLACLNVLILQPNKNCRNGGSSNDLQIWIRKPSGGSEYR